MPEAEENESVLLGGKSTLSPIESPHSLKLTANLPLKNGGWETIFSFWGSANFQVRNVSLREGTVTCHDSVPAGMSCNIHFPLCFGTWIHFTQLFGHQGFCS